MFWYEAKAKIIHWYCGYRYFFSIKNNFICLQKRSSSFFSPEDPQNALPDRFGRFNTWVSIGATQKSIRPCMCTHSCAFTSSSLTLRWWRPRSSGLRSEGSDCRRTWSGTGRSSRRPRRRCCCRAAREPRVRSCRWWFGSAAGKESTAGGSFKSCWTVCPGKVFKLHHGNQTAVIPVEFLLLLQQWLLCPDVTFFWSRKCFYRRGRLTSFHLALVSGSV